MSRLLFVFVLAAFSAGAATLNEKVNCFGDRRAFSATLPPLSQFPPDFGCGDPGLEAVTHIGFFNLWAAAVAYHGVPIIPRLERQGISAYLTFEGVYSMTYSPSSTTAFWSACVRSSTYNLGGNGYGIVAGSFGPFAVDSPCDFAHSLPALPQNTIPAIFSVGAQDGFAAVINIRFEGFDALGNPTGPGFSHYDIIAGEIPEPSVFVLVLIPVATMLLRHRRRDRSH